MPHMLWCWRCRRDVPMLTEDEYQRVWADLTVDHDEDDEDDEVDAPLVILESRISPERFRPALDLFEEITGAREIDVRHVLQHRASLYGPPCAQCGKALRSTAARQCMECGHGKEAP